LQRAVHRDVDVELFLERREDHDDVDRLEVQALDRRVRRDLGAIDHPFGRDDIYDFVDEFFSILRIIRQVSLRFRAFARDAGAKPFAAGSRSRRQRPTLWLSGLAEKIKPGRFGLRGKAARRFLSFASLKPRGQHLTLGTQDCECGLRLPQDRCGPGAVIGQLGYSGI